MKSKNQYSLLLLFIAAGLISNCSKAPTSFERENPNDPDNPVFEIPASKELYTQIEADKVVQISWTDTTKYIDGYVLSKSIDGTSFEVLDSLEATSNTYTDTTGKVTKNTKYTLYSYRKIENGSKNSEILTTGISLGEISLNTYSASTDTSTFNVSWQFDNSWPFIVVAKLTIYNDPSVDDIQSSTNLDTLYNQETSYAHEFIKTFDYYYLSFEAYLNQEDLDNGNAYDSLNIYPYGYLKMKFSPQITSSQIVNESSVRLNWKDNSTFEDGFEILRGHSEKIETFEVIATLPPNTTTFADTLSPFLSERLDPFGGYESFDTFYSIRAIKGSSKTSSDEVTKVDIEVPKPTLYYNESNATSIKLNWTISSTDYVKNFILERSINSGGFQAYKTFDKNTYEYTVTELDTTKNYSFRIRTIVSHPSNTVVSRYMQPIIEHNSFDFPGATSIRSSKSDKYLVASAGYYSHTHSSNDVVVFDLDSGTEIYRTSPFDNPVDGVDINEDNNLIGMVSSRDQSIKIIDFIADTVVYEVINDNYNTLYDIEFSPDGNYFYIIDMFSALRKYSLLTKKLILSTNSKSPTGSLRGLSISPTGDSIAVSVKGVHQLFSPSGTLLNFPSLSIYGVTSHGVTFSRSGKFLTTVRDFDHIGIQNTSDGQIFYTYRGRYADMHHSDRYLATLYQGALKIVDLVNEKKVVGFKIEPTPKLSHLRYSNTRDYFFFGTDENIKLYKLSESKAWVQTY